MSLVQWAKESGNVDLIIGNHDAHYFKWQEPPFKKVRGAGFSDKQLYRAYHMYIENKDLFKTAVQIDNYLWTHAGLSHEFYVSHIKPILDNIMKEYNLKNLAEVLNKLWDLNYDPLFMVSGSRGGDSACGGIFWADIHDTIDSPLSGYNQIVGHTAVQDILHKQFNKNTSNTYIDCLNFKIGKFYELDILT